MFSVIVIKFVSYGPYILNERLIWVFFLFFCNREMCTVATKKDYMEWFWMFKLNNYFLGLLFTLILLIVVELDYLSTLAIYANVEW